MADLCVSPEGLRTTAGTLNAHAAQATAPSAGVTGASSQSSIAAVQGTAALMSSWHSDEAGYHGAMAESLTAASAGYENTDQQGGQLIGGVM